MAAGVAFAESVTSDNIVGYAKTELAGKKYNATGACFITPGASDDGTFTLANVTPTAYDYESDNLFVMNPDDSSADAMLIYLDAATAAAFEMTAGWYDGSSLDPYTNVEWNIGTGFMTSFDSGTPDFNYAGEVFNQAYSVDCKGLKYNIIPNGLPRAITLSEVTATGYDYESDNLYIMNPDDSSADAMLIYLDAATAAAFEMTAGWYDGSSLDPYADYEVAPGAGFMTSFDGGNVVLNFPKVTTSATEGE